jgi:lipopolysaccharide assembly protein A
MTSGPGQDSQHSGKKAPVPPDPRLTSPALPAHRVKRTRIGGLWVALGLSAIVLLLLLIFILENGQRVSISYFGAHGHLPLGVALLLAAVLGVLVVVIPGTGRIIQLRLTARRHRRLDAQAAPAPVQPAGPASGDDGGS